MRRSSAHRRFSHYRCITYAARGWPPSDIPNSTESYSQERAATMLPRSYIDDPLGASVAADAVDSLRPLNELLRIVEADCGATMLSEEEECPVEETLLGELYHASPLGLHALVDTVPAKTRALLAHYCYRRSHLFELGLAIASTCDRRDLIAAARAKRQADLFGCCLVEVEKNSESQAKSDQA